MNARCSQFGPLRVEFDGRILAPRPWTLLQSRRAAIRLRHAPPGPLVELHCGAGHVGQATAAWSGRALVQVDDDPTCCTWAAQNARANGVHSAVLCGSVDHCALRDAVAALVIADPPYVPSAEAARLLTDPIHAIDGGVDGLDGFRACLPAAARLLRPRGALVLQVRGADQVLEVARLAATMEPEVRMECMTIAAADRAVVELVRC